LVEEISTLSTRKELASAGEQVWWRGRIAEGVRSEHANFKYSMGENGSDELVL